MKPMPAPTTPTAPRRMTVAEFLAVPEAEPGHWQLVEGEVVVNFPTLAHQKAIENLSVALAIWRRAGSGRGQTAYEIDTAAGADSILGPDLQWYADGRELNDIHARPQPLGDIVVEVRSPATWSVDIGRKRAIYEREGVQELWLVDPLSLTVVVFARSAPEAADFDVARDLTAEDRLDSPLLPGFGLRVADIFRMD